MSPPTIQPNAVPGVLGWEAPFVVCSLWSKRTDPLTPRNSLVHCGILWPPFSGEETESEKTVWPEATVSQWQR